MIKAAVFDIGGVLEIVDDGTWPQQWMERWEAVGAGNQPHTRGTERPGPDDPEAAADTGPSNPSESETRDKFRLRFGLTEAQADAMMADMWDRYCGRLDVRLRDFVAGLRPRLTTAILSNSADGARREEQRRYDFAGLVDTIIYSHEVGMAKPDPAIYELATARRPLQPHGPSVGTRFNISTRNTQSWPSRPSLTAIGSRDEQRAAGSGGRPQRSEDGRSGRSRAPFVPSPRIRKA